MTFRLARTTHFLTVDVADWSTDPALPGRATLGSAAVGSPALDGRPGETVNALLDQLSAANARATFFLSGDVAQRDAPIVRRIVHAGHEAAACGSRLALGPEAFRADVRRVKDIVEDAGGVQVSGFRSAALQSRTPPLWRFETLIEEGYEYDSSRLPGRVRGGLDRAVPSYPQTIVCGAGTLIEVPLIAHPHAQGALSIRRASYPAMRRIFAARTNAGLPGVVSFATWEIDRDQPQVDLPFIAGWRHYRGRRAAGDRVARLLTDFRFDAIGYHLSELAEQAPTSFAV